MISAIIEKSGAPDQARAAYNSMSPMKRTGRMEEIAPLLSFLASDEAGFINGAEYAIDGASTSGMTAVRLNRPGSHPTLKYVTDSPVRKGQPDTINRFLGRSLSNAAPTDPSNQRSSTPLSL